MPAAICWERLPVHVIDECCESAFLSVCAGCWLGFGQRCIWGEENVIMWTRAELKDNAKKYFKFNYWKMVLVALVMTMIGGGGSSVSSSTTRQVNSGYDHMSPAEALSFAISILVFALIFTVIAFALSVFLFNPLTVGAQRFFVVSHYQKAELGELGYAFSNSYMNVVKIMFLRQLYIFLWSLLFVIPGIIKGYEYRMIPYILAENPGIESKEAFAMSKQMMDGNKWNAFVLDLSFLGWIFLSLFTCGILAVFYVSPYIFMTDAELYVALKEITFGSRNQGYQQSQNYQGYQNYQSYQGYQNYQGSQNYQNSQSYQGGQNYQDYQGNQSCQSGQNYQGYQDANQTNAEQPGNNQQDNNF